VLVDAGVVEHGRLARDDDRDLDGRRLLERKQHVADHRPRETFTRRTRDARAEPRLGLVEALDWEDRGGAHLLPHDSGGSAPDHQPSSIIPTVTPGPIVTIRQCSPGSGARRSIVSLST